jgi:hypothetical protein
MIWNAEARSSVKRPELKIKAKMKMELRAKAPALR